MTPAERSPDLRALADEYWEATMESAPTYATFVGDHRYDDRLDDLSAEAEGAHLGRIEEIAERVGAINDTDLSAADQVTRSLLLAEVADARLTHDHHLAELASDQMTGAHAELLQLAPQTRAETPEQADMLVDRYRQVDRYLAQAADRFRSGVSRGRPPAAVNIERSLNQVDGYLASPLDDDPFANLAGPDEWADADRWRQEMRDVTESVIRPAFDRYADVLRDELLPVARGEDQPGLSHVDGGAEVYEALIRLHTTTDLTARELHDIGLAEVTDALPAEYATVGARALDTADLGEIFARLRTDESLRYDTGDQILADATAALDRATAAMSDWFGHLPTIACEIEEIPEYLAADAPAAYYFPPSGDGARPGTYFVNTHNPADKSRTEAESIGYHEAIPGHHLQIAIATELDDVPDFQRFGLGNTAYVEGWALYTERLADEMGLYGSDLDRLGMLTADAWRAGRLVVDTGLHAFGWTRGQAIDFLVENTPLDPTEVAVEIDRYIGMPGQALAYKTGQRELFRLRSDAEAKLGDRFDIKAFHDRVLAHGAVTLPVLADLVATWVQSESEAA